MVERSKELNLQFPAVKGSPGKDPIVGYKMISVQPQDYLGNLVRLLEKGTTPEDVQLLLFVTSSMSHESTSILTQKFIESGVELLSPIAYDSGIAVLRFKHGCGNMAKAFSSADIPGLFAWQLVDSENKILMEMRKYTDSLAIIKN